ncbi:MAG: acyl-CoA thioester hydrolase [Bacteroidia bacterium]|jgi:acyl-CoA thioester hydrolase
MDSTPTPTLEQGVFRHSVRVRYGETDQMGRVHHANYLLYLEEARTGMMRALGASYAAMERDGVGLPVRKADLRYRAAALYEEELVVETRIERVGPVSVTFAYRVVRPEIGSSPTLIATGSTELACISMPAGSLMHLPDSVRGAFLAAMESAQG